MLLAALATNALAQEPSASDAANPEDGALIESSKVRVARDLKDPASVQFRDVVVVRNGKSVTVCGEYNAKNSYGAYVGFQKFFASPGSAITEGESAAARPEYLMLWAHLCQPRPQ
jgi:hypothetical protein